MCTQGRAQLFLRYDTREVSPGLLKGLQDIFSRQTTMCHSSDIPLNQTVQLVRQFSILIVKALHVISILLGAEITLKPRSLSKIQPHMSICICRLENTDPGGFTHRLRSGPAHVCAILYQFPQGISSMRYNKLVYSLPQNSWKYLILQEMSKLSCYKVYLEVLSRETIVHIKWVLWCQ